MQGWDKEFAVPAAEMCGRLPLAVSMVAGVPGSPSEVLAALQNTKAQHPVDRAIEASIGTCSAADAELYTMLAVFPEDVWIPVQTLISYLRSDAAAVREFVQRMLARRLVQCQESNGA